MAEMSPAEYTRRAQGNLPMNLNGHGAPEILIRIPSSSPSNGKRPSTGPVPFRPPGRKRHKPLLLAWEKDYHFG